MLCFDYAMNTRIYMKFLHVPLLLLLLLFLLQILGPVYIEFQVTMTFRRHQSASYIEHTDPHAGHSCWSVVFLWYFSYRTVVHIGLSFVRPADSRGSV